MTALSQVSRALGVASSDNSIATISIGENERICRAALMAPADVVSTQAGTQLRYCVQPINRDRGPSTHRVRLGGRLFARP